MPVAAHRAVPDIEAGIVLGTVGTAFGMVVAQEVHTQSPCWFVLLKKIHCFIRIWT